MLGIVIGHQAALSQPWDAADARLKLDLNARRSEVERNTRGADLVVEILCTTGVRLGSLLCHFLLLAVRSCRVGGDYGPVRSRERHLMTKHNA